MLDKLNKQNLSLIRAYLPEIVMVLLTVAVVRLQIDVYKAKQETDTIRTEQVKFEREVNTKVLIQLSQNTDAMKEFKEAMQNIISRQKR